jgi:hypothetical protein
MLHKILGIWVLGNNVYIHFIYEIIVWILHRVLLLFIPLTRKHQLQNKGTDVITCQTFLKR